MRNLARNLLFTTCFFSSILLLSQNIPNGSSYPSGTATSLLPSNYVSGVKVNYVRSIAPSVPVINEVDVHPLDPNETKVSTNYMDGLGRSVQTVNHFGSPTQNDLVTRDRGKRTNIRVPPGKQLAHKRGKEAAKGFSYEHSDLQDASLHKTQHQMERKLKKQKQ